MKTNICFAIGGVAGLVTRRAAWLCALAALSAVFVAKPGWLTALLPGGDVPHLAQLALCFGLGSLAYAWRDALPVSLAGAAACVALVAWNPAGLAREALFPPLLVYVVLVAAYDPRLRFRAFNRIGDYSYGLYVYAFPIQQTIVQRVPGVEPLLLLAYAFPAALAMAVLSWHAIEHPALGLKSRFD